MLQDLCSREAMEVGQRQGGGGHQGVKGVPEHIWELAHAAPPSWSLENRQRASLSVLGKRTCISPPTSGLQALWVGGGRVLGLGDSQLS